MNSTVVRLHATCLAVDGNGILLRGHSGAGKSDLALRLIDGGADLVADDQVLLAVRDGRLWAAPPPSIAGRLEVRGIGIVAVPFRAEAPVVLVVDLVPPESVERLPEPRSCRIGGIGIPLIALTPFEVSAAAKVRLALRRPGGIAPGPG
ncbi:MAG: HPr kinase/phosphorylase [Alphaproteobacteria bacterium]